MKLSKYVKMVSAAAILSSALAFGAPTMNTASAASVQNTQQVKKADLKSYEQMKKEAIKLFNSKEFEPAPLVIFTAKDYEDEFSKYSFLSNDISEQVQGMTSYGRTLQHWVEEVKPGVYENTFEIVNDRDEETQQEWESRLDKAEKYIVDNYPLETDYEVVHAIVDFVGQQISYGKRTTESHEFMLPGDITVTCNGYMDYANELYKRFGIESRLLRGASSWDGDAHAWNAVKVGGKWYHSDATKYDAGNQKDNSAVLMTQAQGSKARHTTFKATDVPFEQSMAKDYDYKEVKKSQAKQSTTPTSKKKVQVTNKNK